MKPLLVLLVLSTVAVAGDTFDDMLLRDGTILKNVEVTEITDRGLKVKHNDGTGLIKTDQLPAEVKKRYAARIEAAAKAAGSKEPPAAPAPAEGQPASPAKPIPGLKPADAIQLCGKLGLVSRARPGALGKEWTCGLKDDSADITVTMAGPDANSLTAVTGTVIHTGAEPGNARAQKVFSALTSLAYTGADPVKARQWITENMDADDAKTTIGGVTFRIKAGTAPRTRILRIAHQ